MSKKNIEKINMLDLENQLKDLYKEKFKLLIEKTNGTEFKKQHILRNIKLKIARLLTHVSKIKREKK